MQAAKPSQLLMVRSLVCSEAVVTGVRKAAETAGLNLSTTELTCVFGMATAQAMQPIRDAVRQSEPAAEPAKATDHKKSPASCGAGG